MLASMLTRDTAFKQLVLEAVDNNERMRLVVGLLQQICCYIIITCHCCYLNTLTCSLAHVPSPCSLTHRGLQGHHIWYP